MPVVGNDPRNGSWEKEFEKNGAFNLPDCRLKFLERTENRVYLGQLGQAWDKVYCAICCEPKMAVPPDCPHVYFICPDCVAAGKVPPDAIQVTGT